MVFRVARVVVLVLAAACTSAPGPSSPPREARPEQLPPAQPAQAAPAAPVASTPTPPTGSAVVDDKGCVVDPLAHAARIIVDRHGPELSEQFERPVHLGDLPKSKADLQSLPDLDGDGAGEIEVAETCCWGVHAWLHVLYLSNRGCLRFAGELVDGELGILDTVHDGVRDLGASWSNGCAGLDFAWTRYAWNGERYRVADKATCWFCTDPSMSVPPPGANRHPYCKQYARRMAQDAAAAAGVP
jgi:hypothetical protein